VIKAEIPCNSMSFLNHGFRPDRSSRYSSRFLGEQPFCIAKHMDLRPAVFASAARRKKSSTSFMSSISDNMGNLKLFSPMGSGAAYASSARLDTIFASGLVKKEEAGFYPQYMLIVLLFVCIKCDMKQSKKPKASTRRVEEIRY
jgi:hypothetical protein